MEPMKYYPATVSATGLKGGEDGKKMCIVVEAQTEDGETGTAFLYCSPKAWPYTEERLAGLGWDPAKNGYRFEELNGESSPIIGAPCRLRMKIEMYEGKEQRRFDIFTGGLIERMEPAAAQSFAARLRAEVLGGGGGMPPNGHDAPPPPDDDIPF